MSEVQTDRDRDGSFETRDVYSYAGAGACRQGANIHRNGVVSDEPKYRDRCLHSPVNDAILNTLMDMVPR